MKRHFIKKKKLMMKETSRLPRERPASVSSLLTTMEDGEKDEEMKPRGGSMGDASS